MLADFLRTDPRLRQAHTSQIAVGGPLAGSAVLGRSGRLGWVQRLYLALLIHAQNDRLIRRVQIEPHDATLPWGEFWRRLDVCRSSCRTFLSPVEPRWRQPPAAPGGIANRSNRFAGE